MKQHEQDIFDAEYLTQKDIADVEEALTADDLELMVATVDNIVRRHLTKQKTAAPAMYKALKNLLGYPRIRVESTGSNITHAPILVEYIKAAEQALAQAEGKVNIYDDTHRS